MIVIFDGDDLRKNIPKDVKDIDITHLNRVAFGILSEVNIAIMVYNGEFKVIKNRYINRVKGDITEKAMSFEVDYGF